MFDLNNIQLNKIFPALSWLSEYDRNIFKADFIAGCIVMVMLIPQSLAYAMLAGMPIETGLYASILPLVIYAIFGTSRTLSVGPVALISLMTMSTLSTITETQSVNYVSGAITLAFLSGIFLLILGIINFGFIANYLSMTVISGFISASAVIIILSQLKYLLGIESSGENIFDIITAIFTNIQSIDPLTTYIGMLILIILFWSKMRAEKQLNKIGLSTDNAALLNKAVPIILIALSIVFVKYFKLDKQNIQIVGLIPNTLPLLQMPQINFDLIKHLWLPALSISLIGYIESISVGKSLAAKRREQIDSNQELIALGSSNIASSFSGGFPVTGGISRSVVNFEAGAVTPAAGVYAAIGIALTSLYLTPLIYYLPKSVLAATIIVAVFSLIDTKTLLNTWSYSKRDFIAVLTTIVATLTLGVEVGVCLGLILSLTLHLIHTSRPHIAEIGLISGTQHFRNVDRFSVQTNPSVLSLRMDESLFFANAKALEDFIYTKLYERKNIEHVVLLCSAINEIDYTALTVLEEINEKLLDQGVNFHLSEVKGPVMDSLLKSNILEKLSGNIYLTHYESFKDLTKTPNK
jgi:SulP family sulfate permease